MPFKSQAQRGFLYAVHPDIAKEFEAATPKGAKLPKKIGTSKTKKTRSLASVKPTTKIALD